MGPYRLAVPVLGRSISQCQRRERSAVEPGAGILPGIEVCRVPFPGAVVRAIRPLQRPQLIEGLPRLGAHRSVCAALEERRGENDLDGLQGRGWLCAGVGAQPIEKSPLVRRRLALSQRPSQGGTCEELRHAGVARDAWSVCGSRPLPGETIFLATVELPAGQTPA